MSVVDAGLDFLHSYNDKQKVNVKAVPIQVALMTGVSLAVLLAFSFFRPREKKVYAPKVKYRLPEDEDAPPPQINNGFFSWLSPLLSKSDLTLVDTIGVDAVAFLQFLSLLRWAFLSIAVLVCGVLIPINVIYTLKSNKEHNALSMLTIANLGGKVLYVHLGMSYIITGVLCYWIWFYWRKMLNLRQAWFMSARYQRTIQSRSLMITNIKKEYQSDEGLRNLMVRLQGGNEKVAAGIQNVMIGRDLKDYPQMIEDYNDTVKDFEAILVKYLKGGVEAKHRPMITRGGFLGMGGTKIDAIEFYATKLGRLREVLDAKKIDIDQLKPRHRKGQQGRDPAKLKAKHIKIPAENYGFVSMMDAAQAHAIAKAHKGRQRELFGAELTLAPAPNDLVWKNANITPAARRNTKFTGMVILVIVMFLNTVPLLIVAALANLAVLTNYVKFLRSWQEAGEFGNWTFSLVAGVLPPMVSAIFGILLPIVIRRLTKYQGAISKGQVDRTVLTRLFAFLVISQFFVFSLLGVVAVMIAQIRGQVEDRKNWKTILSSLSDLPYLIQQAYVQQSTYWLTWFPLRGFLAFFELAQLIKLVLLSVKTFLFAKTPRDIQDWTRPPKFEYPVVYANLLFIAAVGLIYAPLAPLVCLAAMIVFWISHYIYKYQLLYVYASRSESGGRMWNVAINRLLVCLMFMQAIVILTLVLQQLSWQDGVAAAPPFLITLAFKIFVLRPYSNQFSYYAPTREEANIHLTEAQHSYKQRFTHPALKDDVLYTVMVHKDQQDLVRHLLDPYSSTLQKDIRGVREKDLVDYNPELDPVLHEEGGILDDSASRFDGGLNEGSSDTASIRTGFYPPRFDRSYSESSLGMAPSYHRGDGDESRVDLVPAAAPLGQTGGWYGQQQQSYSSDYRDPYNPPSQPANLATLPLLVGRSGSQSGPSADAYPMQEMIPSRVASPAGLRTPGGGYGGIPQSDFHNDVQHYSPPHDHGADMDDYYQPRTQSPRRY